eukprot:29322-Pelagococcus_subviridis.AAC.3
MWRRVDARWRGASARRERTNPGKETHLGVFHAAVVQEDVERPRAERPERALREETRRERRVSFGIFSRKGGCQRRRERNDVVCRVPGDAPRERARAREPPRRARERSREA